MNNKLLLLISMFFLFYFNGYSQEKGHILQVDTHLPISEVNIYTTQGIGITITDSLGTFDLKYLSHLNEADSLYISHVGYKTELISLAGLKRKGYTVLMTEVAIVLGEVVANAKPLQNKLQYTMLAPLPGSGISFFASTLVDSCIFVQGGDYTDIRKADLPTGPESLEKLHNFIVEGYSKEMYRYDIKNNQWANLKLDLRARAYHSALYYNNKMYILGGKRLSATKRIEYLDESIEICDMKRGTVFIDKTNPHQAINFASFIYKNTLILMGGSVKELSVDNKQYSNKTHLLNLDTGCWYELNDMLIDKEARGILDAHFIYLFGGFRDYMPLNSIERYDILSGTWVTYGHMLHPVQRPGIVCVDKTVYIFEDRMIQTYNLQDKTCRAFRIDLPFIGSDMFHFDGKLYIVGGRDKQDNGHVIPSQDLFSIDLSEFSKTDFSVK